jgi:putative membrane protein
MTKISKFLNKKQVESIELAIKKAEDNTVGEIVPVICAKSGRYDRGECLFGLIFALISLAAIWVNFQSISNISGWGQHSLSLGLLPIISIVFVSFLIGTILASYFPILSAPFISQSEMKEEAEIKAKQCFYDYSVGNTVGSTGVLIFISLFERMVLVKGDSKISKKLSQKDWDQICRAIISGIKNKKIDQGIIEGVDHAGTLLTKFFPRVSDQNNELPNKVHFID